MGIIRNILAILGLSALVGAAAGYFIVTGILAEFDGKAVDTYRQFAEDLLESKDPADTMIHSVKVEAYLTPDDVKMSLKTLANDRELLFVGESPFSKQIEAMTGEPYRFVSFLSFSDAAVGKLMVEYNPKYTAFMPFRIALVEAEEGGLKLYTTRLDLMIHGGKPLPENLKTEATRVWAVIRKVMEGAARGDI